MREKEPLVPLPVILAAVIVFLICNALSFSVFEHVPHVNDEIAYLFQAKLFQSGHLTAPSPCAKEFFDFPHIINNGRWYSIYPPGFPFLLMLGLIFKAPWIINPFLASLSILLFYGIGKEIYSQKIGILAAVLGVASPWFLLMSSTMMSHTSSMFFNTLFLFFLFRSLKNPSRVNGLAMGVSLGIAFLIRPFNALLFSFPFLIYYAFFTHSLKFRLRNAAFFVFSALSLASLLLLYNFLTNGNPFLMGYIVHYGKAYSVVFGKAATLDFAYTPLYASAQIADNIRALNSNLFGWPLSSFFALLPLLWLSRIKPEDFKKNLLLAIATVWLFVGFAFFWGAFVFIGARMFFDALPLLLLLSACGINELPGLLAQTFRKFRLNAAIKVTTVILVVFVIHAFAYYFPRFLRPSHQQWSFDRYDHLFAGTTARIDQAIREQNLNRALIILKFIGRPPGSFPEGGWGSGFIHDDPDLRTNIIYARNQGSRNSQLFPCFSERTFYLYLGTLEKGILFPIAEREGKIIYGNPLTASKGTKKGVELLEKPQLLFKLYSKEFETYLDRLYEDFDFADVDTDLLRKMGIVHQNNHQFREAVFCFEAALQIENNPEIRRALLERLVPCYLETGQREEAVRIEKFMERTHFNERKYYSVSPERGF